MQYDVCCQWSNHRKAIILGQRLRQSDESMGAEAIERFWSKQQPLHRCGVHMINEERCGEGREVTAGQGGV